MFLKYIIMYMSNNHEIVALHIALHTIVVYRVSRDACVSHLARLWPMYRALRSWHRQKIRLSDYYNVDYRVDRNEGIVVVACFAVPGSGLHWSTTAHCVFEGWNWSHVQVCLQWLQYILDFICLLVKINCISRQDKNFIEHTCNLQPNSWIIEYTILIPYKQNDKTWNVKK